MTSLDEILETYKQKFQEVFFVADPFAPLDFVPHEEGIKEFIVKFRKVIQFKAGFDLDVKALPPGNNLALIQAYGICNLAFLKCK